MNMAQTKLKAMLRSTSNHHLLKRRKRLSIIILLTGVKSGLGVLSMKPLNNMKKEAFVTSLGSAFAYVENDLPVLKWELNSPLTATTTTTSDNTTTETTTTTTTEPTTTTTTTETTTTETTTTTESATTTVGELTVSENEVSLKNGDQYTIVANRDDITFESNNKSVAVVNSKGVITALGEGTAIISVVTSDYDVVQIKVTVAPAQSAQIFGDPTGDGKVDSKDASFLLNTLSFLQVAFQNSVRIYRRKQT